MLDVKLPLNLMTSASDKLTATIANLKGQQSNLNQAESIVSTLVVEPDATANSYSVTRKQSLL